MVNETLRIGVWQSRGKIYRRDSEKEPYPRVYQPKVRRSLKEIKSLAENLHFLANMSSWTPETEAIEDSLVRQLRQKIRKQIYFGLITTRRWLPSPSDWVTTSVLS